MSVPPDRLPARRPWHRGNWYPGGAAARRRPPEGRTGAATRPHAVRELLLVAALWCAYTLGRLIADGHVAAAFANARWIDRLERTLRLPAEAAVQHLLLQSDAVVRIANSYYAVVHFPATAAFLVWLFLRRPGHYRWARRSLAGLTGAALVVHLLFPLAPPRMLPGTGLIDTGQRYGPSVYGSPHTDTLTNQYAAMPSLHVGWALLVAVGLITATRSRWRWLWVAHPAITLAVVVGTANHYWIDGIVAGVLVVGVLALLPSPVAVDPGAAPWPPAGPAGTVPAQVAAGAVAAQVAAGTVPAQVDAGTVAARATGGSHPPGTGSRQPSTPVPTPR